MASAAVPKNSIKLLSWNIQKFGENKLSDSNFLEYVCQVISVAGADLVGIMELVGWKGNEIRDALVLRMNNLEQLSKKQTVWVGAVSEMTPSRPNEQYLFLWKAHLFSSVKDVLCNVIGDNDFSAIFTNDPFNWDQPQQEKFWAALYETGYIDAAYMMVDKRREELVANPASFSLSRPGDPFPLTARQTDAIVKVLLAEQTMGFPSRHSRPPFLLRAITADTNTSLFVMLFHAPGPGSDFPLYASNQLSFVGDVAQAIAKNSVGVVMGDFNLDLAKSSARYHLSYFAPAFEWTLDAAGAHIPCVAFQRLTGPDLVPPNSVTARTRVLDYFQVVPGKTSITTTAPDAGAPLSPASFQDLLRSEYDRFFVRSAPGASHSGAVIPLIAALIPGISGLSSATEKSLITYATLAYNSWVARQKFKKFGRANLGPINGQPASVLAAHQVYKNAISDHLPISMDFFYA